MSERFSLSEIVDADTFSYYIIEYVSHVADSSTKKKVVSAEFRSAFTEDTETVGGPMFLMQVYLDDCPWKDTPPALQRAIGRQYDTVNLDESKSINLRIDRTNLLFTLKSPSVKRYIDSFGENLVYHGLSLNLVDSIANQKGSWFVAKQSAALKTEERVANLLRLFEKKQEGEQFSDEEQTEWNRQTSGVYKIPATLEELRAIVEFMERFEDRAEVIIFE